MSLVLVIAFTVLMLLAIPVGHALIIAAGLTLAWQAELPLMIVAQQMYQQTQSFPMLALPFFMMAGSLMLGGKLGEKLLGFATKAMQRWRGGPLSTTVVASVVFGGVSGSAVANASALGSVLIPWQKRQGYPAGPVRGQQCHVGDHRHHDPAVDPAHPLLAGQRRQHRRSVHGGHSAWNPDGGGLILTCSLIARRRGIHSEDPAVSRMELLKLAVLSGPALLMPILILLGLRFGIATPTEISVLAVVYALALSAFFYRDLTWKRFYHSLIESGIATGVVMLVIMGSAIVGWILTFDEVPTRFAEWVTATISNPLLVILAMNILLLIVGMPLDLPPAILLLGPIFVPLAASIGLDPVQLGIIMVLNLGIGLYTPPIGTTLFISSSIARASLADTTRELWPFLAVSMLILLAISYIPALTIY